MSSEAAQFKEEAEKKLKGGFFQALRGGPKYDEASDLFVNAANVYKVQKLWNEAAKCYDRAAEMQAKLEDQTQEAKYYVEAGNALKNVSTASAAGKYELATKIYVKSGRFAQAARLMKTLAETNESEGAIEEAKNYYKKSADWFELDEYGKSNYTQCILKYADLIAKLDGKYDEAIKIYESEGTKAVKNELIRFGAKAHFFKAGLLQLVKGDAITASVACERYEQADPGFAGSREGQLLKALCQHYEADDVEKFVDAIAEYDRLSRIDEWKVFFMNKVKSAMTGRPGAAGAHTGGPSVSMPGEIDGDDLT